MSPTVVAALELVAVLLTGAALARFVLTVRSPTPWRIALTASSAGLAVSVLLAVNLDAIDNLMWPNAGKLVEHLLLTGTGCSTLIYVDLLRRERIPPRQLLAYFGATIAICVAQVVGWMRGNLPDWTVDDLTPWAVDADFVFSQVLFYFWLVGCLVTITVFCLRNARNQTRDDEDLTRRVGLRLIGFGTGLGIGTFAGAATTNLLQFFIGRYPLALTAFVNGTAAPALLLIAFGLFTLVVLPRVESTVRSRTRLHRLRPLYEYVGRLYPMIVLPDAGLRLAIREQSVVIEIYDALTRIKVDPSTAVTIPALANAIRTPAIEGIAAASVLATITNGEPISRSDALAELAAAFNQVNEENRAFVTSTTSR